MLTASISLPRARYPDDDALIAFTHEALQRLRALPGVTAAGATDTIPFGGNNSDSVILAEGYQMKPGESVISPSAVDVTPGYFEAMGARLVRGRFFDERDAPIETKTTAIGGRPKAPSRSSSTRRSRSASGPARIRSAAGCTSRTTSTGDLTAINEKTVFFTVVGVVGDIKLHDLTEGRKAVGAYYFPMDQDTTAGMTFAVKTAGDPLSLTSAVRGVLNGLDRELPVFDTQTMDQRMEKSLVSRRSPVLLSLVSAPSRCSCRRSAFTACSRIS